MFPKNIYVSHMAAAALMAFDLASRPSPIEARILGPRTPDPTDKPGRQSRAYHRKRVSKYRRRYMAHPRKGAVAQYKGSRRAKKATRLGGNPARF
jgi:hypothetical protein